jgi:hypothetical protein
MRHIDRLHFPLPLRGRILFTSNTQDHVTAKKLAPLDRGALGVGAPPIPPLHIAIEREPLGAIGRVAMTPYKA